MSPKMHKTAGNVQLFHPLHVIAHTHRTDVVLVEGWVIVKYLMYAVSNFCGSLETTYWRILNLAFIHSSKLYRKFYVNL